MLGKLLDHLFNGSAQRLVAHLIQEDVLSEHDRQEIRALFESLPAERPKKGGRR
jgi:predicted transcriptional regulator